MMTYKWNPDEVIAAIIFNSRYLLVPLYLMSIYSMGVMVFDGGMVLLGNISEESLAQHTLQAIKFIDITMSANLIWLISAGSTVVFALKHNPDKPRLNIPRVLNDITSGLLKVKMAGSIVGISSVALLELFLRNDHISWDRLTPMLIIHGAFIAGLIAFYFVNAAHDAHQKKEEKAHDSH